MIRYDMVLYTSTCRYIAASLLLFFLCHLPPAPLMAQSGFKLPALSGKTLQSKTIDSTYFKDKLTLITFFYIGCAPCMKEIPVLNKLQEHFKDKPFQILAVAPHAPSQLRFLNSADTSDHSALLAKYKTRQIQYEILPECPENNVNGYTPQCYTLSRLMGVSAYPTSFFVNGNNEILMTTEGFPMRENESETFQELVKTVDAFLLMK